MYLGIDLGTSEVKVLLLDAAGSIVGTAGEALTVSRPQVGWAEQSPDDWWQATCAAIGKLRSVAPRAFAATRAIGLSGQMHGAVLLDARNRVLRPAILWNDTRSTAECLELTRRVPSLHAIAGNLAMPGFTAPKLLWSARHEPAVFDAIDCVLLPKDYLRLRLTGERASDPSDAGGTLWLDVARRTWSDELLAATGLSRRHMPRLVEGSAASGTLLPEVADAWGLAPDVIVAGGGGDGAASAVGIGATQPGDGFLSLGTSGVIFVVNDRFHPNPAQAVHAFCHALPERWHQMSVMLSAASCLRWFCRLTSVHEATLLEEIAALPEPARESAPFFLPYLSGERTPHNDALAQGHFHNLTHASDRAALGYAVIEGVAFGMADGLDALRAAGTQVASLSFVGGGSRSPFWAQLLADTLSTELTTHVGSEAGGALGAARLGWMADGGIEATVCAKPPVLATYRPDAARHARLAQRLSAFRALYRRASPPATAPAPQTAALPLPA
ncbi:xylulokinase [Ralstonia mannitolilytica]|uniref:Xylulose kinase n=1 Tax=Ralstonia mannitolilytica TaxID=105219 RepID=A0AAJ5D708_9RALS|nr:xylulokinase [Ralstonia mannitolilytica]MBU9577514.1 xylulokinase [Ralstonia mannitolilytica]CAG2129677.1 Xylulose kinase [Ralstonia mannitolilytica]CAJ0732606.1 Xylulose kinase [Ralstonia mannitolilytica]SUE24452.1 Xylulose kinase [Ralstonia mannitolilytica]SUE25641.1 Xylulose kinase [Ralstonia mannitolilytica]